MKILLTGATGFIGRYVVDRLIFKGIDFVTIGRKNPNLSREHINADLLSTNSFDQIVEEAQATHLIHLAWFAEHGKYWTSPLNNKWTESTVKLIEAFCNLKGQGVVVAGTCAEYDWSSGYCSEKSTLIKPQTLYGQAKDETRKLVFSICDQNNVCCAWGRIFFPYGKEEHPQRLIPSLISVFRGERPPFGVNSSQYRDLLYAHDVAEAFIFLLLSGKIGVFNISSGKPIQIIDVVYKIATILDKNPKTILDLATERPGEPILLVGKNSKLKSLGWKPEYTLDKGLKEVIKHY